MNFDDTFKDVRTDANADVSKSNHDDDNVVDFSIDRNVSKKITPYEFWNKIGWPKKIVAPMVDHSDLAYRMLCRKYGMLMMIVMMVVIITMMMMKMMMMMMMMIMMMMMMMMMMMILMMIMEYDHDHIFDFIGADLVYTQMYNANAFLGEYLSFA